MRGVAPGLVALAAIAILVLGAFAGLGIEAARMPDGALAAFDARMLRVAWFTVWQAALSTLLSVAPAILLARALFRQRSLPGRRMVLWLFAVPLALPALVAALGVLSLFGRAGLLADLARLLDLPPWPSVYGLPGILIAHVFFNLPLATRLLLEALETVPPDEHRLAAQFGLGARATFRAVEWPAIRTSLPGAAGLVFMLCVTSFTIVLSLGGGPAASTLEVAIYQSLRFDFDPARAVVLALTQLVLTGLVLAAIGRAGLDAGPASGTLVVARRRPVRPSRIEATLNILLIAIGAAFVAGPLAAIAVDGFGADLARLAGESAVRRAVATSLVLALGAAFLAVLLSLALVAMRRRLEARRRPPARAGLPEALAGQGTMLVLVVPPLVIGAGWFVLLRNVADAFALAPALVVAVNAVMAMPFASRILRPAYDASSLRHDRLAAQLGLRGATRWRIVDWPVLRAPLAAAFAFAMALSLGDLGVIALFGSDRVQTLPYLLLGRMSSYRTQDAAGLALMLGLLCLLLVVIADRLGRERRR